jgi:hypothetical protein
MRVLIWWSLATLVTVAQPGCTTPFHTATDAHAKGKFDKALERAEDLVPTPTKDGKLTIDARYDRDRLWVGLEKAKILSDAGKMDEAVDLFDHVRREAEFLRHIESAYANNPVDPANWDFEQLMADLSQTVVGADQTVFLLQPHEEILCNTYAALDCLLQGPDSADSKAAGTFAYEARRLQQFALEDLKAAGYEVKEPPASRMDGTIISELPDGQSSNFSVTQIFTLGDFSGAKEEMKSVISSARAVGAANPVVAFSSVVQWAAYMRSFKATDATVAAKQVADYCGAPQLAAEMKHLASSPNDYPFVLVLVDAGRGPVRRSFNVRLPIVIPNVCAADFRAVYPALKFRTEDRPRDIRVGAPGDMRPAAALDSIDAIVARDFQRREAELWWMPTIRAGIRTAASLAIQIQQSKEKDKTISVVAALASVVVAEAEQPDLRAWTTLPATQHAALIKRPANGKVHVELASPGASSAMDVDVPEGSSIIYIRALTPTLRYSRVAPLFAGDNQPAKPQVNSASAPVAPTVANGGM